MLDLLKYIFGVSLLSLGAIHFNYDPFGLFGNGDLILIPANTKKTQVAFVFF